MIKFDLQLFATIGDEAVTWKDYASQLDPDGSCATVIDVLQEQNDIIQDMPVVAGNKEYGILTTQNAADPVVSIRGVNEGIDPTKGAFKQLSVNAALFTALLTIDKELLEAANDKAVFRANMNKPFIGAMGKKLAEQLFYGSMGDNAQSFNGLTHFYNATTTADFGDYVLKAGGSGTDNRSLWLIDWGQENIHGFFPKNSIAGLDHTAFDVTIQETADGKKIPVYQDLWEWRAGIVVRNYKKVVRIANIDASTLATIGTGSDTSPDLMNLMIEAMGAIPNLSPNARFYCGRKVRTALYKQINNKSNALITPMDIANKPPIPSFMGVPIRLCEVLDTDEAVVS